MEEKKTFAGFDLELVARYGPKEFGRLLRSLRQRAGKTQAEVGAEAGIDQTYVSLIETGKRDAKNISFSRLARLLEAYGVSREEILALVKAWEAPPPPSLHPSSSSEELLSKVRPSVLPLLEEGEDLVFPEQAKESVLLYLPALHGREAAFFAVRVRRNFLEPAAYPGDLVVVELDAPYEDGDLVAAAVLGAGLSLGRYRERRGAAFLEPLLPWLNPLPLSEEAKVLGVVVAAVRELRRWRPPY